jgi:hypothetical protein
MRELSVTPQARKVLLHLEKHKSITPLEAFGVYGIFRLAARVWELRKIGKEIATVYMTDDNGKPYARYRLV